MESHGRGGRRARSGEYEQVLEQGRDGEVAVLVFTWAKVVVSISFIVMRE